MARGMNTAAEFVAHWRGKNLPERSVSQSHFMQLCELLGVAAPHSPGTNDAEFCFEALAAAAGSRAYAGARGGKRRRSEGEIEGLFRSGAPTGDASAGGAVVRAPEGTRGWCDVWKRGHFCWEYKRQDKGYADLDAALRQLREYKDSLDNPPLLIACDIDRFLIVTNFTSYPVERYEFSLDDLADPPAFWREERGVSPLQVLRFAFTEPGRLRPKRTVNAVTEEMAEKIGRVAKDARDRKGNDSYSVAHFLMQVMFSLYAEDAGLLPDRTMTDLLSQGNADPARFFRKVRDLFEAMAEGGSFGALDIEHFNGGLFRDIGKQAMPHLAPTEIGSLLIAAGDDWSAIEPSILGTLFERSLDPDKRAQIGAHYTSRGDIMLIIEPVVMRPLRREWEGVKSGQWKVDSGNGKAKGKDGGLAGAVRAFHERLCSVRVLDPACGSGNFLYVAIQCLLDLEKEVIIFAQGVGVRLEPRVGPGQLRGIEINPYAAELARVSIWIGYLKWQRENGVASRRRPILDALDTIEQRDAILEWRDEKGKRIAVWREGAVCAGAAAWPEAEFIIGNPPFLGTKMLRGSLGDEYVESLFATYKDSIPGFSDLCCYWFELARRAVEKARAVEGVETDCKFVPPRGGREGRKAKGVGGVEGVGTEPSPPRRRGTSPAGRGRGTPRVGLLATQAIRNGAARRVLERIKETGDIFMAWSDREWVLDGAAVRISMVGFDDGAEVTRTLDGAPCKAIHADLSTGKHSGKAEELKENQGIGYVGDVKGGPFDLPLEEAMRLLAIPSPNRRSVAEVLREYTNGLDITRRHRGEWVADFGSDMSKEEASKYGAVFDYVERLVKPMRQEGRPTRGEWWLHMRPCPSMRDAVEPLPRYVATPTLTKHRMFAWMSGRTLPDHQLIVFARSDDYFFGVLHSCVHEVWARRMGTQLREAESGFRYTPTTCFETFALPWSPGKEPGWESGKGQRSKSQMKTEAELHRAIGGAARELNELREAWLNPAELIGMVEKQVEIKYREELKRVEEVERGGARTACPSGQAVAPRTSVVELVRRSAVMAEAAKHPELKKRTLTNLYNARPAWLRLAHEKLDRAVLAAYAAVDPPEGKAGGWDTEWAGVYEPFGAGEIVVREKGTKARPADSAEVKEQKRKAIEARKVTDEKILSALLRLNGARARGQAQ